MVYHESVVFDCTLTICPGKGVVLLYTPFLWTLSLSCLFKRILCERFPLSGHERGDTYVVCTCMKLVINGLFEASHVFFIILGY